jgi:tetratricopeptide (TPR) repeat protein
VSGLFRNEKIKFTLAGLIITSGLVVSISLTRRYNYRPYLNDSLYLPSGKFISQTSLGYRQLAADFVWFSAIQYYGDYRLEKHDLSYFEGLIDIVTTLDPHFTFAYIFSALVVSTDMDAFDDGVEILKRGMQHNPTAWKLPFEIGFLYYVGAGNPDLAARYFDLASRLPGSPELAGRFAAFVYSKAGHRDNSIRMWQELLEHTDEPYMRELAEHYLEKLRRGQGGPAGAGRTLGTGIQ